MDRVAEFPSTKCTPALRPVSAEARVALSARRNGADQYAIAHCVAGNAVSNFVDYADRLVTDDQAVSDGILALQDMKICATDGSERDPDNRFSRSGPGN